MLRDRDSPAPRDPALDLDGVPGLIERARAAGLDADAELALNGTSIPTVVGQAGFRIVQESVTNVMRHVGIPVATACAEWPSAPPRLEET